MTIELQEQSQMMMIRIATAIEQCDDDATMMISSAAGILQYDAYKIWMKMSRNVLNIQGALRAGHKCFVL